MGLCKKIFVRRLTDGLKAEYQNVRIVHPTKTTKERYRVATKIVIVPSSTLPVENVSASVRPPNLSNNAPMHSVRLPNLHFPAARSRLIGLQ